MSWLQHKPRVSSETPIQVVMYTRAGCHLCDEAWTLLEKLRGEYSLKLEAIDVDEDAKLATRYGERVPVVFVEGTERFWGRVNRVLLERLLQSTRR